MSKEAMKLALEALVRSRKAVSGDLDLAGCAYGKNDPDGHRYADAKTALVTLDKAITALREALAEQSAQGCNYCNHALYAGTKCKNCSRVTEQAAIKQDLTPEQPAQRTWVGLSDEEKRQLFDREDYQGWLDYINAIEAKLKEKNT